MFIVSLSEEDGINSAGEPTPSENTKKYLKNSYTLVLLTASAIYYVLQIQIAMNTFNFICQIIH